MDDDKLYGRYIESRQKYDYFLSGLSTAVLAYAVQSFDSGRYSHFKLLAPISWILLLLAVLSGLARIKHVVAILGNEPLLVKKRKELLEFQGIATHTQKGSLTMSFETFPFRPYTLEEVNNRIKECTQMLDTLNKKQGHLYKIANRFDTLLQIFLILGLILLGLLKALNL